jgi:hypothetical protein
MGRETVLVDGYARSGYEDGRSPRVVEIHQRGIRQWVERRGWRLGRMRDECSLAEAIERIESRESDGLVVARISHLGSSLEDGLAAIERIEAAGGRRQAAGGRRQASPTAPTSPHPSASSARRSAVSVVPGTGDRAGRLTSANSSSRPEQAVSPIPPALLLLKQRSHRVEAAAAAQRDRFRTPGAASGSCRGVTPCGRNRGR